MRFLGCSLLVACLALCAGDARAWQFDGPPIYRLPPIDEDETEVVLGAEPHPVDELLPSPTEEDDPPRGPRGGMGGDRSPYTKYMYWIPAQKVKGQASELTLNGAGAELAFPLSMREGNLWLMTGGVHRLEIGSSAILPDSHVHLPNDLWKIHVGTMHMRELANGWQAGGMLSVGSASDEPFDGIREMTATGVAFLNIPTGENDAWNFSLFYSPTSQLPFPVPGVSYVWRPSEQLEMKIGVPFSVQYRPTETLTLSATYTPLTNIRAMARQKLAEKWELFGGYEIVNDTYFLSQRIDTNDRLYFFDQRVRVGLERQLLWGFSAELSAAYVFDREIFQATSFSDDRHDQIRIAPGLMGMLNVIWSR